MKTRLLVAVLAAAGGGGCGRIQLDDGPGPGDGGDICEGLTDSACGARPGCAVAHLCACPGEPSTRCVSVDSGTPLNCTLDIFCPPDPCGGLSENACSAQPGCTVATCPTCDGTPTFAGCYSAGISGPQCPPGGGACPPSLLCRELSEAVCPSVPGCAPSYCPACPGQYFTGCGATDTTPAPCPITSCPPPCASETTLAGCETHAGCHAVFAVQGACSCPTLACCTNFSRCADGARAICKKGDGVTCRVATPSCEEPYVVSYTDTCYEGCVLGNFCAE
jgi:hypothetical protein